MLKSLHEARKMPNNCTPGNKMLPSRRLEGKASRLCRSVFVLLSNAWYRRTPTRRLCLFLMWGRSRCCSVPHWERLFLLPCVSSSILPQSVWLTGDRRDTLLCASSIAMLTSAGCRHAGCDAARPAQGGGAQGCAGRGCAGRGQAQPLLYADRLVSVHHSS